MVDGVDDSTNTYECEVKLFGKWPITDIRIDGKCGVSDYVGVANDIYDQFIPHSAGRWQVKRFRKQACPVIERLTCALMMHGRNSGKKCLAVNIVKQAFEFINATTDENPVQICVSALCNAGPREDSTRVGSAGVVRRQAGDVRPLRRVNVAINLIVKGARESAFRNVKTMAECLADELIYASKNDHNSYAIKKKHETERVALSAR